MISKKLLVLLVTLGLAGLGIGCGDDDGDTPGTDAGGGTDTGTPPEDTGTPPEDTGTPPEDTGTPPEDSGGMAVTCAEYCTTITASCAMGNRQYMTEADCNTYCMTNAGWEAGVRDATSGNTIACRLYHAGAAEMLSDPDTHCPHAGESGADTCGTWCENYCQLALRNCTGDNVLYPDMATCATACAAFADDGEPDDTSGNTVQCRIYHLGVAGTDAASADTHCPHGGAVPTAQCL
jgi:hypothetical protein